MTDDIPNAWRRTMRLEWTTETGLVTLTYPGDMTCDDVSEFKEVVEVVFAGMVRRASAIEARSGKTRSGLIEDESVTPSGGTQETLINQDFANE